MIPYSVAAAGKAALQIFRDDRAEVWRFNPQITADEHFLSDVMCHLSRDSLPVQSGEDAAAQTSVTYTVFLADTTPIRAGDKLTIIHKGQVFKGIAGRPFRGTFSLAVKLESVEIS